MLLRCGLRGQPEILGAGMNPELEQQLQGELERARKGDRGALARLISVLERGGYGAACVERGLSTRAVDSYTVGITGAPAQGSPRWSTPCWEKWLLMPSVSPCWLSTLHHR